MIAIGCDERLAKHYEHTLYRNKVVDTCVQVCGEQ